ncbi:MAG TPA: hypothetical protein VFB27_00755, partial [Opitutaceae bacterium]|nr:hypothetical protein [Opitutaceae bacterium]
FDPAATGDSSRNGLANMRSRIEEIKGLCQIVSAPGRGASVSIVVDFSARVRIAGHGSAAGTPAPFPPA